MTRPSIRRAASRLALAAVLALAPVAAVSETLTDALILAYRHSGLLEKNRAILRAADEDVAQAVATLRPIINYSASVVRTYDFPNDRTINSGSPLAPDTVIEDDAQTTVSLGISAELLLYDGGSTQLAIAATKELVLLTRDRLEAAEQEVLLNAVLAYVAVRRSIAFVELRRSNVQLIQRELQAARDRFEVGEVTRTDVAIAEARLASARSNLAQARGDFDMAIALYVRFVGQEPGPLAPPPPNPQTAATLEAAQAVARRMNPNMRVSARAITVAEINVLRAEASIRPRVTTGASLGVDRDLQERLSVDLTMTGPIYRGGALTSIYRQAAAARDESRADLHITRHQIDQNVADAWAAVQMARASIAASQEEIRAARVAFEGVREEATLGARTTLDVLIAEQDLLDARSTLISAQATETESIYTLLAAMGLLTADHLRLGIVTYDPEAYYNAVRDAPVFNVSPQGQKLDRLLRSIGKQ